MTRLFTIEWVPHAWGDRARHRADRSAASDVAGPRPARGDPNRIPLKRFGKVEEMAGAIRYPVSPQASYITGQILLVDGGLTAY